MGGGFAGWVTPGWMTYEKSLGPHVHSPGTYFLYLNKYYRLCQENAKRRRKSKRIDDIGM